jgi:putative acetyltransferase
MDTREIQIRGCEPDDYEALRDIHAQPKTVRGTLQLPFPSKALWKKRLAEPPDGLHTLVACVDGAVVGSVGLLTHPRALRRRHVGEIGISVHDAWHRRGVGRALLKAAVDLADNWLGLTRLELTVFTDNAPAIELYKRFGFEIEGRLRRFAFRDGAYVDAYAMARLS